jgi:DNA-binding transcriptional LysR family regulator
VGAFPTAIASMLLPVVIPLSAVVRLHIIDLEPEQALAALAGRTIDAAIIDRYERSARVADTTATGLDHASLRVERIRLVHPSNRRPRSIESLANARWILGGETSRLGRATRAICASAGFTPNVVVESDDHHVAFDAIRSMDGVALLPELALAELPPGISVARRIDTEAFRHVELVTRHVPLRNAALAALEFAVRRESLTNR